jgi:hypothetical protein
MATFYPYFFDDIYNKDMFCVIILSISCTSFLQIYHLIYKTHMYKLNFLVELHISCTEMKINVQENKTKQFFFTI